MTWIICIALGLCAGFFASHRFHHATGALALDLALGVAGAPAEPDGPPFGRDDAVPHPQYHLKLLLARMGVARGEVEPWHRSGLGAAPPTRSRAISNLFLPPAASAR